MNESVQAEVEELFRRESKRLISVLTRILGPQNLELAEDVMQDSFIAALDHWADVGIPGNPTGWILTTARNRAIDAIRRERTRRDFAPDLAIYLDSEWTLRQTVEEAFGDDWVKDDQLRMIFMCCHPTLAPDNRLPIILKTMCGLSVPAIARALLTTESTVNKRLYRTRRSLEGVAFALPTPADLPDALETVHTVLYLLFNEGNFSSDVDPIRHELCRDAMSLARLLVDEPTVSNSDTVALLSLMCFSAARFQSRIDNDGRMVPLDQQDRSLWDPELIAQGHAYLGRSTQMEAVTASRYHLEAAIASRHCTAEEFEQTDWESICNLYDRLLDISPSAMTQLNRAVAISFRDGALAAIPLVEAIHQTGELPHQSVVAATLANLYGRTGNHKRSKHFLDTALVQAKTEHERRLIELQVNRATTDPKR